MIETIIFDLSEVAILGLKGTNEKIAVEYGDDSERIRKHFNQPYLLRFFEGKISEIDFWKEFSLSACLPQDTALYMQLVRMNFHKDVPGTFNIISKLRLAGYNLGLLSDHGREWVEYLEPVHKDLMGLFDTRCYSFQSGHTKLDKDSFEYALQKTQASRESTLFIDDNINNLNVARQAGIGYTLHFTGAHNLEDALAGWKVI